MSVVYAALTLLIIYSYLLGTGAARHLAASSGSRLHSQTNYYGYYTALCCGLPPVFILCLWFLLEPVILRHIVLSSLPKSITSLSKQELDVIYMEIRNIASGALGQDHARGALHQAAELYTHLSVLSSLALAAFLAVTAIAGLIYARSKISVELKARQLVERYLLRFFIISSSIAVLTTLGIVLSLIFESVRFFRLVPLTDFLFGLKWSPQIAIRTDQVGSSGAFGAVPLFTGTALIALIAMCVAVPIGLFSAIYLSEYASPYARKLAKPTLEILAGIPTVVYGFFAALTVAPYIHDLGVKIGLNPSPESALAAGVVMGIMIIPFVSSLSDDVINAVPQTLRDGSYALGATQSETIRKVVLPAALPGIVGSILLAISRAVGETMIVVMAAGLTANLTADPLSNVTTVTVQIVTILVGDQEFNSPKTLSAFALGLTLLCITLCLNIIALQIVKQYRERYE